MSLKNKKSLDFGTEFRLFLGWNVPTMPEYTHSHTHKHTCQLTPVGVSRTENSEVLPYLPANTPACHSVMDAGGRQDSWVRDRSAPLTAASVGRASPLVLEPQGPIPQGNVKGAR